LNSSFGKRLKEAFTSPEVGDYIKDLNKRIHRLSTSGKMIYNYLEGEGRNEYGFQDEYEVIEFASKIDKAIESNTADGWPLTNEMDILSYMNIYEKSKDKNQRDELFVGLYEENNSEQLNAEKDIILENITYKYRSLTEEIFDGYANGYLKALIPSLITVIEGEVAKLLSTKDYGWRLMNNLNNELKDKGSDMNSLVSLYCSSMLASKIFTKKDFDDRREATLNRNWELHGRDDPNKWTKSDFYSLISILSSFMYMEEVLNK